jgi:hypothetical protein
MPETRLTLADLLLRRQQAPGMRSGGAALVYLTVTKILGWMVLRVDLTSPKRSRSWSSAISSPSFADAPASPDELERPRPDNHPHP